jgi:hypothetical protein
MIEKNSEVMSVLAVSSENESTEYDYLDYIKKKKDEKKNGHGEGININIVNIFPDLYIKKTSSEENMTPSTIRNHQLASSGLSAFEMMQSIQKRQAVLISTAKIKESDASQALMTPLSNSRLAAPVVSAASLSGKLTRTGDEETKEQATENTKIHSTAGHLKNDLMSQRQAVQVADMKSRTPQPSTLDRMVQASASVITETAVTQKKSLNLDYPFSRWSGEHSVKVSIPVDLNRAGYLTLLPSDPRAAEMLSRQINQLNGYTTELLHPQQDDEEAERRHAQQHREEEPE